MENKVKKSLNKTVSIEKINLISYTCFEPNGGMSPSGRNFVRLFTAFFSMLFLFALNKDSGRTVYAFFSFVALALILCPLVVSLCHKASRKHLDKNNLEDILAMVGLYGIAIFGSMLLVLIGVTALANTCPIFIDVMPACFPICAVSAAFIIYDIVKAKKAVKKLRAQNAEKDIASEVQEETVTIEKQKKKMPKKLGGKNE